MLFFHQKAEMPVDFCKKQRAGGIWFRLSSELAGISSLLVLLLSILSRHLIKYRLYLQSPAVSSQGALFKKLHRMRSLAFAITILAGLPTWAQQVAFQDTQAVSDHNEQSEFV